MQKFHQQGACRTFEFSKWKVTPKGIITTLIGFYHPPYSTINPITNVMFLNDLTEWLSEQVLQDRNIILARYFNIHVNNFQNNDAFIFHNTMVALGLEHYISNTQQWQHLKTLYSQRHALTSG